MDAIEALKTRRSVRAYTREPISKEILEDIIDCGRLAATACNEQLWEFVVVTDARTRARLAEVATNGPFLAEASACVAVLCRDGTYYLEDGCAATQNILVAARARGLGSCWVAGDKKPYAAAVLDLLGAAPGCKLVSLIALGHAASTPKPIKRSLNEVLHWEKF